MLCPKRNSGSGTWICCDICETWYHVRCLKMTVEEFEVIDQYHCSDCAPKAGPSTGKQMCIRVSPFCFVYCFDCLFVSLFISLPPPFRFVTIGQRKEAVGKSGK